MTVYSTLDSEQMADRLAIRELVDAYAYCADRRDAAGQMALFTADTHFVVYMNAKSEIPPQKLHGRESLAPVFENLNSYRVTTHFNGQPRSNWTEAKRPESAIVSLITLLRAMERTASWLLLFAISTCLLSKKAGGILLNAN